MKTILSILFFYTVSSSFGQSITIGEVSSSPVIGGFTVNVKTFSSNGAGFLSSEYSFVGNIVTLKVCYWFNNTLQAPEFENIFFIPYSSSENCTIKVEVYNSSSTTVCDYFSFGSTRIITFLEKETFEKQKNSFELAPNPSSGIFEIKSTFQNLNHDIYNMNGQLVEKKTTLSNILDLSNLIYGIYLIRSSNQNQSFSTKINIKK